jgi:hypothetical protein
MAAKPSTSRHGKHWSRDELVLALDLYCRIPFAKTKAHNEMVIQLAGLLGREPGALAMKLGNLGARDPKLKARDISGLVHGSKADRQVWEEFYGRWDALVSEADRLRTSLGSGQAVEELPCPEGPSERVVKRKDRLHQRFFHDAVLSSYDETCCVTGVTAAECLVACHIVPWHVDERWRADPTNGLCLSGTFHMLFDAGLLTITQDHRVRLAGRLLRMRNRANRQQLHAFDGKRIRMPHRFWPNAERLAWHRETLFRG